MKSKMINPVFDFINTLCNFIVLNAVFLITCLPVITIGAALSSLYYVTMKEAQGEYGYLVRTYLKEFKNNLKSATAAFLILFFLAAVLLFNIVFWNAMGTVPAMLLTGVLILAAIAWFLTFTYAFPLIACFENNTQQTLKNAFALAVSNLKMTLGLLLMDALVFFFCMFLPPVKILMVLFGFAFIAYCQCFLFAKVFEPYKKEAEAADSLN